MTISQERDAVQAAVIMSAVAVVLVAMLAAYQSGKREADERHPLRPIITVRTHP